ncbi:KamA family radical SAM protein [Desulfonema limicola]|uniref:KamA family radical SAM protein n=1 Tax=Desulfonema limicola TaxID=45656 RepID=A0A975BEP0_9BACT|nr:KamA family radical SAM protein [Desulfonema limicola]QTA83943.1 KamA family radical SAM protein [Desulfonema limicola]
MTNEIIYQKLLKIINRVPDLKDIFLSPDSIDEKRHKIRYFLSDILMATFEDNPAIPPLEWVLTRNAVNTFRSVLSSRSERLTGFSLLEYIDNLLHKKNIKGMEKPSQGFLHEFDHLVQATTGQTHIYSDKAPAFIKYKGRKAAKLRSVDLSKMAKNSKSYMDRYACGLDNDVIRRRSLNKERILKYFNATDLEWEKWQWHTRHIIRDADTLKNLVTLKDEEYESVMLARQHKIPFGITPYYLSLMDYGSDRTNDAAVRAQVIPPLDYVNKMKENKANAGCSMDFMLEHDTSPIDGITRRYPNIVILKPIMTCPQICVYCQRNWEIEDVYSSHAALTKDKLDKAVEWIKNTPEINEVLVTGGDPLLLSNEKIENILSRLSKIKHIERIRIGTRTLVTMPQRITESLIRSINRFHIPGKQEIIIITHFEHLYEITPQSVEAVQKFRRYGIDVYNQLVYTFYNSRRFEAAALRHKLKLTGVTPYYTFNTKGKEETNDYRVPIARLLQEQHEEARLMPGTIRTDEIVFNVPGLGKNYLRATQHHDVISILPDGCRVYEFHPWEKKLALMDTYVYTDVSIYDYLQKLKNAGEKISDYNTIWYYY